MLGSRVRLADLPSVSVSLIFLVAGLLLEDWGELLWAELVGEVSVDDLCVGVGETREPCGVIKQCDEREMYKVKDERGRGERERERPYLTLPPLCSSSC